MFKNPFRDETHDEYRARTLAMAKLDLLKSLENVEFYESVVSYRRKQIARLEQTPEEIQNEQTITKRSSGMLSTFSRVQESRNAEPTLSAV